MLLCFVAFMTGISLSSGPRRSRRTLKPPALKRSGNKIPQNLSLSLTSPLQTLPARRDYCCWPLIQSLDTSEQLSLHEHISCSAYSNTLPNPHPPGNHQLWTAKAQPRRSIFTVRTSTRSKYRYSKLTPDSHSGDFQVCDQIRD
jgi:hypothetical protein